MEEYMLITIILSFSTALLVSSVVSFIIGRRKAFKKINKLLKKAGKMKNITQLTRTMAEILEKNQDQHQQIVEKINELDASSIKSIKKVAYERYDATEDIGGHMSFSLALLDEQSTGILLTNIYMGDRTFLYLREVKEGQCSLNISDTEKEVIQRAREAS
ncbi:MAG: DUF4446 family protein [Clostridia bacterium]